MFEKYKTPIDMITTSEVAVSVTIDDLSHLEQIQAELESFGTVEIDRNQAIICVVGNGVAETKGVIKSVMDALADGKFQEVKWAASFALAMLHLKDGMSNPAIRTHGK